MKKKMVKPLVIVAAVVLFVLLSVFLIYESPEKFVRTSCGFLAQDETGDLYVYHEDIFGNTFTKGEDGWRNYCEVPSGEDVPIEKQWITSDKIEEAVSLRDSR